MFRPMLPAALSMIAVISPPAAAETLRIPGLSPDAPLTKGFPDCVNQPFSQDNCVRVLACVGEDGLWFDGQARGWDEGQVMGVLSDGTPCAGTWTSRGFLGTGRSTLECENTLSATVIYHTQHNETGTVIGSGRDTRGRWVKVWSGLNVLEFLRRGPNRRPELPCSWGNIPIS